MHVSVDPLYLATIQAERERTFRAERLVRLAERLRDCCRPSTIRRLAHALRLTAATC